MGWDGIYLFALIESTRPAFFIDRITWISIQGFPSLLDCRKTAPMHCGLCPRLDLRANAGALLARAMAHGDRVTTTADDTGAWLGDMVASHAASFPCPDIGIQSSLLAAIGEIWG